MLVVNRLIATKVDYIGRYHDQCISPGNVLCGTTTNVYIKSVGNISYDFLS
jgi:hypothetical protein